MAEPVNADLLRLKREILEVKVDDADHRAQLIHDFYEGDFQKIDKKEKGKRQKEYNKQLKILRDLDEAILKL